MAKLKGHTEIILTDVNTGKVTRQEGDNMFTNAIQKILTPITAWDGNSYSSYLLPLQEKGLAGLLLFQNSLPEDANNYFMPAPDVNPVTGYAGNNAYTGTNTQRGSMNTAECEELDNGYKFVWDFTTAQANGTISAISLTNYYIATTGVHGEYWWDKSPNTYGTDFEFNITNCSYIEITDDNILKFVCYNNNTITYYEIQLYFRKYNLNTDKNTCKIIKSQELSIEWGGTIQSYSKSWIQFAMGEDGYIYGLASVAKSVDKLIRLDASTLEQDTSYGAKTISGYGGYESYNHMDKSNMVILNSYIYYIYSDANKLVKLNVNDITDVTEVSAQLSYSDRPFIFVNNNHVTVSQNNSSNGSFDTALNKYSWTSKNYVSYTLGILSNAEYVITISHPSDSDKRLKCGIMPHEQYLATINNITPVTKTAAQTMKIIYTITEAK